MPENDETGSRSRPKGRTFSFNFSCGKKPPIDDPRLDLARASKPDEPDDPHVTTNTETFTLDFADGKLRVGRGEPRHATCVEPQPEDPATAREAEMWGRLERIAEGTGAYPDTARWHARLSLFVWVIAIALPLAALIATVATGQSLETIVFVTFGATFVAAMFRGSIR